jgi:hypothetical protein
MKCLRNGGSLPFATALATTDAAITTVLLLPLHLGELLHDPHEKYSLHLKHYGPGPAGRAWDSR